MKIAIFSDIHGNLQALESILEDISNKNIDKIYCLGDVIGIGPNPKECLDLIIKNKINMVLGNHELYYLKGTNIDDEMDEEQIKHQQWIKSNLNKKHYEFLSDCNLVIKENINDIKIEFKHFFINNKEYPFLDFDILENKCLKKYIDSDITFIGHFHTNFKNTYENKILNCVGSSGCIKNNETFYTLLTISNNIIKIDKIILNYDRKKFLEVLDNTLYPEKDNIIKIFFK